MKTQDMSGLGKRISALRRERGLTQDELATRLCITPQAISKWERGTGLPDLTVLPALAQALGVSLGELFGERAELSTPAPLAAAFEGLPLVAQQDGVGCYSDKVVTSYDESGVDFADGSRANFVSRTVTNCGVGEIRLVESEQATRKALLTKTELDEALAPFDSIDITNNFVCDIRIVRAEDGIGRIQAKGTPLFISLLEVSVADGTLRLNVKSPNGGRQDERGNRITLFVGFERGERLGVSINGCAALMTELSFAEGSLTVNGSGDITVGDMGKLMAGINGAGGVRVGDVEGRTQLIVNGSGDIEGGRLGHPLHIGINGSGDVKAKSATDVTVRIAGSGDVAIDRVREQMTVAITGSGDVCCGGEVEGLNVSISGGGELSAAELSADVADIHLSGSASATVGRIVRHSVERVEKNACLHVLRRG